jgi:prepilin-type N-terminal cleavage/methylation domain-containing protein
MTFYMKRNNIRLSGFTLIEILIVVAIIAILSSVVLVGLGPTQQAGRDARRLSDLRETQTGLELYYSKCGYYPGGAAPAACPAWAANSTWAAMAASLTGSAIGVASVPIDPTAGKTYYYTAFTGGSSYTIGAVLENANNAVFTGYAAPANPPTGITSCAASSTYCITL